MKALLMSATAVAALVAGPAIAADIPLKGPRAAPEFYSWTGLYIGTHKGIAWADVDWANVTLTGEPVSTSNSSWLAGGQVGFNYQIGSIVFGVEGTIAATDLSGSFRSKVNPVVTYTSEIDRIATATGRLGVAWDRSLIYVKGGGAWANLTTSGRNPGLPDAFSIESTRSGWVVGGGVEFLVTNNFVFGFEYNHIDLGTHNRSGTTTLGIPFTISNIDTTIDTAVMRASWKFGGFFAR
jgi:outer membrane immunogenic protein